MKEHTQQYSVNVDNQTILMSAHSTWHALQLAKIKFPDADRVLINKKRKK